MGLEAWIMHFIHFAETIRTTFFATSTVVNLIANLSDADTRQCVTLVFFRPCVCHSVQAHRGNKGTGIGESAAVQQPTDQNF